MGSAFKCTTNVLFRFVLFFLQTAKTICINLPSQVYIVPEQTAAIKKKKKKKKLIKSSKVPFKENASPWNVFPSYPFVAPRRSEQKARESIASFSFFPPGPLL